MSFPSPQAALVTPDGARLALFRLTRAGTEAPALLWGHANGFAAASYRALLKELAESFDVWAWDARAHGASAAPVQFPPRTAMSLERLAADASVVCNEVRRQTGQVPYVAAHSFSGIALLLAGGGNPPWRGATLFEPPLVTAETFLDPGIRREVRDKVAATLRRRRAWASPGALFNRLRPDPAYKRVEDKRLQDHAKALLAASQEGLCALRCAPEYEAAVYEAVFDTAPFERLQSLTRRVHFVASDATPSLPRFWPRDVQPVAAARARGTWERLPGSTHLLPLEMPASCAAIVRRQVVEEAVSRDRLRDAQ